MKYFRRTVAMLLALVLAVTMMVAFAATVMAANVCREISGSSKQTTTFTVKTGSRWLFSDKLKLTQTKGRLKFDNWGGQDKEYSMYDRYSVTYTNESNGKTKTAKWTTKNLTLKLDKNTTYTITIKPAQNDELQLNNIFKGAIYGWTSYPTWSVSSTKGIEMCK